MLVAVAVLRTLQLNTMEAIEFLKLALRIEPGNILVLNNLATLLSERTTGRREALAHVTKAIDIAGPRRDLLDTKAVILAREGFPREAIQLLNDAVSSPTPDPRYYFHLAAAYRQVGDAKSAVVAFQRALDDDLMSQILTPVDRQLLNRLRLELLPTDDQGKESS